MTHSQILLGSGAAPAEIAVRRIDVADLKDALAKGFDDFKAMPTHAIFLVAIYPIVGLLLARLAFGYSVLPLLYPLAAGFALIGPLAGLGLYELSRQREAGLSPSAGGALDVMRSSSLGGIVALALLLTVVFALWIAVANALYIATFGYATPQSIPHFLAQLFTTTQGWTLIIAGNVIGFLFAALVLCTAAISFPLLLDRDVGAAVAVSTSLRAVWANPATMAVWGLIVAGLLLAGSIPFFIGLTVVMPVLGHATWHLYRKLVDVDDASPRPVQRPLPGQRRYAADFPSVLFPWSR